MMFTANKKKTKEIFPPPIYLFFFLRSKLKEREISILL